MDFQTNCKPKDKINIVKAKKVQEESRRLGLGLDWGPNEAKPQCRKSYMCPHKVEPKADFKKNQKLIRETNILQRWFALSC